MTLHSIHLQKLIKATTFYIFTCIFLCILFMQSCRNIAEPAYKQKQRSVNDTNKVSLIVLTDAQKETHERKEEKIDSSKIEKGFNDIFFGVNEVQDLSTSYQTFHNESFKVENKKYDSSYGLWQFTLASPPVISLKRADEELNDISSFVLDTKIVGDSSNMTTVMINETTRDYVISECSNIILALASISASGGHTSKIPDDCGIAHFREHFFGKKKQLKIGIIKTYECEYGNKNKGYLDENNSYPGETSNDLKIAGYIPNYKVLVQFIDVSISSHSGSWGHELGQRK